MRFAKLSLAAVMAMSVSAFADIKNIKVSGDAKLYYSTDDQGSYDLFDKKNSLGQTALDLSLSADLAYGVVSKIGITALSTLGLENTLAEKTWSANNVTSEDDKLTQWWVNEAWIAKTIEKTTIKVGRQELNTPFAFSERWNIATNSFDSAILLNQDIPKTTLVAAWIGRGNGAGERSVVNIATNNGSNSDNFRTYGSAIDDTLASGAYAFGAITTAIPMTTAQVWYYDISKIAQAVWVQADIAPVKDLTFGIQYALIDPTGALSNYDESSAWAGKVGYEMGEINLSAAYSMTDEDGKFDIANTATGLDCSQSKLYTEAWWNYGVVSAPDTDAWTLKADYELKDIADLGLYYTGTSSDSNGDMTEVALVASRAYGSLDTTLAYIYTEADEKNSGDSFNTLQVYLTYNF
jgi:hypothetical protein